MAFTITTPRLLVNMNIDQHPTLAVIKGGVGQLTGSWIPPIVSTAIRLIQKIPTVYLGAPRVM
jgi:hypothetical protein